MPAPPKGPPDGEEAFLSRWSRRKRTEPVEDAAPEPPAEANPEQEMTDEELLAELELPDPDTMTPEDDFSAFMRARVPERLRRRALRVLWRSNPVLANLDELVDYGEDFTDSATVVENMQTVYEVGKGAAEKWKRHLAALAAEEEEGGEIPAPSVAEEPPAPERIEPVEALTEAEETPLYTSPVEMAEPVEMPPTPRHMRFSFEDGGTA